MILGDLIREKGNETQARTYYRKAEQAIQHGESDELEKTLWLMWIAQRVGDTAQATELEKKVRRLKWGGGVDVNTDALVGVTGAVTKRGDREG